MVVLVVIWSDGVGMSLFATIRKEYLEKKKAGQKAKDFATIRKEYLEKKKAEQEAKEKAEREYAAKQASVDTEIVESSNGNMYKNSLKIRKGRSSGSGRNLV